MKDSLLASLYIQVELLRGEIEEKNLLIRTLTLREADVYRYRYIDDQINSTDHDSSSDSGSRETLNKSSDTFKCSVSSASEVNEMNTFVNETQDTNEDFNMLYAKYEEFEDAELKKKNIYVRRKVTMIYLTGELIILM